MKNKKLHRPVGLKELNLIKESGMKKFPPRLPWQPIFYPVLHLEYAEQIAKEWNTNDEGSGYTGFVTLFEIPENYFQTFEIKNVGGDIYEELWVSAEQLEEFNDHIIDRIQIVQSFYGNNFQAKIKSESKY